MALPDLSTGVGMALFRRNPGTGELFFVSWVTGKIDFALDTPGPGTWEYRHAIVKGDSSGAGSVTATTSRGTILAQNLRR